MHSHVAPAFSGLGSSTTGRAVWRLVVTSIVLPSTLHGRCSRVTHRVALSYHIQVCRRY